MGKTIFISSHILSELADLCDSVTIIDRGKVKYTGSMNELLRHSTHELVYEIQLTQIDDAIIQSIEKIEGINKVTRREDKPILTIAFDDQKLSRRDLLQKTLETGADIQSFKESQRQLNQVFMDLTDPGVRS
jgi:ABC-2 type transport system ATP-binding protein